MSEPQPSQPKHLYNESDDDDDDSFTPALPPHMRKPDNNKTTTTTTTAQEEESNSESDGEEYCPALPPHMMPGGGSGGGGISTNKNNTIKTTEANRRVLGPKLPNFPLPKHDTKLPSDDSDDGDGDDGVIGPLPPAVTITPKEYRAMEFEERARKMKDKLEGRNVDTNKPLVRESWMTELPEDKPNFCGLGARQFLRKTPAEKGDRSCWTDTPADRERKEKEKQKKEVQDETTPEEAAVSERDKKLTEKVDEYNKTKRGKSLVDLHRKELKRKQGSSSDKPKERKPFSREEDLNVNKFDDAQKEAVMKKARQLNDRFSAGKAKFL